MKVVVLLALVALTGCNAEPPHLKLDQLTDVFWNYVAQATQTAEDTLQMIRTSEFGQEMNTRLTESADVANKYTVTLQSQMTPLAKDVMAKITNEADMLKERLTQDLATVQGKLEPHAEESMRVQVLQRVEDLKAAVAPYAESLDSESLKTTLLQKSEELKGSLEKSVQELQSQLGPYTEELRQKVDQHLEEFQSSVAPLAADLQTQLAQRAKMVQQSLAPYAEDLKDKLDPYAKDLRAQLTTLFESFSKTS